MHQADTIPLSCHSGTMSQSAPPGEECQMQAGFSGAANAPPLLGMLLLLLIPLLLPPSVACRLPARQLAFAGSLLRLRGTIPLPGPDGI
jgi:hypothetical protein